MKPAAAYIRSSKDRADVSMAAQERGLRELATARGFRLAETFSDAVESGKDDDRPNFQRLITAVQNPRRGWDTLLVFDTARIARRRLLAMIFEEECRKAGVAIIYKSLPEGDPLTDMLIKTVMQGFDEWHSLSSRAKGLAGMSENVKAGFRAGGRAPFGYRLAKVATGAIRDGEPVTKSRLELDPATSESVAAFLTLRAAGIGRTQAARQAKMVLAVTSLIGIERNALTYAGHTVWNVAGEKGSGIKQRPRSEWVVQRDTHPALIAESDATALLRLHEPKSPGRRQRVSEALLGGLLVTPQGHAWHGDGINYRLKRPGLPARTISRELIESTVAAQVMAHLQAPELLAGLTRQVQVSLNRLADDGRLEEVRKRDAELSGRIAKLVDMATEMTERAPVLRKIEGLEVERTALARELETLELEAAEMAAMSQVTEAQVASVLKRLAENLLESDRAGMRAALEGLIEKVELDPETLAGRLHYRVGPPCGVKLASPRVTVPIPVTVLLRAVLPFSVVSPRRHA